jgi:argininosuccinate lyase
MSKQEKKTPKPVWAHSKPKSREIADRIVAFCAGRDVAGLPPCDEALLHEDLATNEASFLALNEAGVVVGEEAVRIAGALLDLRQEIVSGGFSLNPELEDVHINLEQALRERVGEVAGKVHSGRSRNDQVACDLRLWHRRQVLSQLEEMTLTLSVFLQKAEDEAETVMPGFSHHQRAFITTWGHQIASYAQAWLRDVERGIALLTRVNRSPLGAAAGFGTSWALDRDRIADLLGFDGIIENSLDAVSSRLDVEQDVASWLAIWMGHCSTLAQDLILYSMEEFRWIRLAVETTTGSSIMPQKRNPDFAEVIKGKTSTVHGALMSLLSLGKGQPSGYHRDSQYSKPLGQDVWREVAGVPEVFRLVFETLKIDRASMKRATQGGFLEAAEWADAIAQESGLPFREVYTAIGIAVDRSRKSGRLNRTVVNQALKECGGSFQVTSQMAKALASPETLLSRRGVKGAPNPVALRNHLAGMEADLSEHQRALLKFEGRIAKKEKACLDRLAALAKP